jgi:hypothetical protein
MNKHLLPLHGSQTLKTDQRVLKMQDGCLLLSGVPTSGLPKTQGCKRVQEQLKDEHIVLQNVLIRLELQLSMR